MHRPSRHEIIAALLEMHGETYAEEIGIDVSADLPDELFHLLCASLLFSTRINAHVALQAARQLAREGWVTPARMAAASWTQRVKALDVARYVRYDESRATMLAEMARGLLERYGGDVRAIRERAGRDPEKERALLKEFKGIGDVATDIFFREVQLVWDELFPFMDERARAGARALGLPAEPGELSRYVREENFPRLVAALVRVQLEGDPRAVLARARELVSA
jgi:endonuclease III